ncbi:MAG: Fe-S oxidoreductase [Bdellovibrionales bacterium CG12_big_fil_rev_8_21_14_0_65_38_15]|nr:MAG: Fe-S oxidoreductase [Bdellovibrionales bacterium CG22_combo_CG10-13_8_21_14_all_38_13]PIQ53342.1 MAG: Fe-S oxidoreductase [Bdellovibrionales bacterium CG12_big_fil_rev_8_21_14_0_65_38_15]PIR30294.1 MAG: Fe-S oxidoreductase [Bdellovibrionales bacterium CG11_big_fil_rev_8_21_14_0_20_38_13]
MPILREYRVLAAKIRQEYVEMAQVFSEYQQATGLHCPKSCARCCSNPDIEATPLEMLPMVMDLLDSNKLTSEFIEAIDQSPLCFAYSMDQNNPLMGQCLQYKNRPSICRMFGVAGYKLKDGSPSVSVCKTLKENYPEEYLKLKNEANNAPLMVKWSTKIRVLDPDLGFKYYQINQAFKLMAQKVMLLNEYEQT